MSEREAALAAGHMYSRQRMNRIKKARPEPGFFDAADAAA
jgi:hypothetical protein